MLKRIILMNSNDLCFVRDVRRKRVVLIIKEVIKKMKKVKKKIWALKQIAAKMGNSEINEKIEVRS
jgi:hypothetical protein